MKVWEVDEDLNNIEFKPSPEISGEVAQTPRSSTDFRDKYTYDHVFGPETSTQRVYRKCCKGLVATCCDGFNGTIMCYGQTSAGKTHTMTGSGGGGGEPGIMVLALRDIFKGMRTRLAEMEQKAGRFDRSNRCDRSDRSDRSGRSGRSDRSDRTGKSGDPIDPIDLPSMPPSSPCVMSVYARMSVE